MKLSKRESNLLAIALVGLAVYIYYNFFLSNIIDRYLFLKKEMNINQQQLLNLQKDKNDIDSLIKEIEKTKKQIAELEMIIPSGKKVPEIITQLESLSKSAGVKLKGIIFESASQENKGNNGNDENYGNNNVRLQLEEGQTKSQGNQDNIINRHDYVEIPIKLNIEGSYNNVISFLNAMEKFKRLFIIKNITLNKKQGDTGDNLEMQLEICAYAVKFDQKLMAEPSTYDFMSNNYGRQNPFKSLQTINSKPASSNMPESSASSQNVSNSKTNSINPTNAPSSTQTQDNVTDFMERFLKLILEDAKKNDSGK